MTLEISLFILAMGLMAGLALRRGYQYPMKIKKINTFIRTNQAEKALKSLNTLTDTQKLFPENQIRFYECYLLQKNYYLCLYHLNDILKRKATTEQVSETYVLSLIGALYETMNKPSKAIESYRSILKINPDDLNANERAGYLLYEMKHYGEATIYLEKAHDLGTQDVEMIYGLADSLAHQKSYSKAYYIIEDALEATGHDNKVLFLKALCGFFLDLYEDSLKIIEKIREPYSKTDSVLILENLCLHRKHAQTLENDLNLKNRIFNQFEKTLSHNKSDYRELILEGRYVYMHLLFARRQIKKAYEQITMMHRPGKSYKDVPKHLKWVEPLIKKCPVLLEFCESQNQAALRSLVHKALKRHRLNWYHVDIIHSHEIIIAIELSPPNVPAIQRFILDINLSLEDTTAPLNAIQNWKSTINSFAKQYEVSKHVYYYDLVPDHALKKPSTKTIRPLSMLSLEAFLEGEVIPELSYEA